MKEFMEGGNLFPGIHKYSHEDFEQQFVAEFPTSTTREEIYKKFESWLRLLIAVLPPRRIWLDGSYLTAKENPNDIDLVVFYTPEDIVALGEEGTERLGEIIHQLSEDYSCDAYFCYSLSHLPQEFIDMNFDGQDKIMERYWMGQFCFDRSRNPKGIIEYDGETIDKWLGGAEDDIASR